MTPRLISKTWEWLQSFNPIPIDVPPVIDGCISANFMGLF